VFIISTYFLIASNRKQRGAAVIKAKRNEAVRMSGHLLTATSIQAKRRHRVAIAAVVILAAVATVEIAVEVPILVV